MRVLIRNKNFWLMLATDVVLIGLSYYFAYFLRFEGQIPEQYVTVFKNTIFLMFAVKIICFFLFNLYRGMWRYTSIVDFLNVLKAVAVSSSGLVIIFLFWFGFQGYSRSVFILDFLLTLVFIAGIRLGIRLYLSRGQATFVSVFRKKDRKAKRLLLIGAGNTGEHVLRELIDNKTIHMLPVGFLDDDATKLGREIHGVPVLGNVDQIDEIDCDFDEILISVPSATGKQMKRIVAVCERTGKPFKTMPPLGELINGQVSLKMVREVSMTDLIGREEVRLDEENIKEYLLGKRVLITGAGGSIGSELVRQIGRFKPQAVALVDFSEFNLYQVEMECRGRFKGIDLQAYLVDLSNIQPTRRVFRDFKPNVVFHAAAYKHVPMQEVNPWEAVYNNVLTMRHLVGCSIDCGVDKFVLVSTDKAVRPTNIMGATKRACEIIASCVNGNSKTRFISVRFGNVLGSSGSVIPLFQQQIARGGPVTVTHPEIIRYFMSIPEAAQLILQAGAMGEGREIFILKMGEPVRILDLAKEVIKFSGFEPEKDIEIVFTGLRPGEKLYEELITEGEGIVPTRHEKIMVLQSNQCGNYADLSTHLDDLIRIADTYDIPAIKAKLKEIVPEYTPQ
jgi:FlaA1/EpsC-like NDP-sugar epimerase